MVEEFTSENRRDFSQRYGGTFGWYPVEKGKVLVQIGEVGDNEVFFKDSSGNPYVARADKGVFFEFLPLNRGLYNNFNEDEVLYVKRVPQRQYNRGISQTNTSLYLMKEKEAGHVSLSFKTLECINNKGSVSELVRRYLSGTRKCVALSEQLAFIGEKVYLYDNQIGTISRGKISLSSDTFRQEVLDVVAKYALPVEVVLE